MKRLCEKEVMEPHQELLSEIKKSGNWAASRAPVGDTKSGNWAATRAPVGANKNTAYLWLSGWKFYLQFWWQGKFFSSRNIPLKV